MKKNYVSILLLIVSISAFSQQTVPYETAFETQNAPENWTHYAISGTDDWAFGHPEVSLTADSRGWETGIGFNDPAESSNRALETPAFDLSQAGAKSISFTHRTQGNSQYQFFVESSIDNGASWQLVDTNLPGKKLNWQSSGGFFGNYQTFTKSTCLLGPTLQGQTNVRFRFRMVTVGSAPFFGWVIEDFYVGPERYNLRANQGTEVVTSPNCTEIKVAHTLSFFNEYAQSTQFKTIYYWSADNMLDASDAQLLVLDHNASSGSNINQAFAVPDGVTPGTYYVIYKHDALEAVAESDENDNISYAKIRVKPIHGLPYLQDFEDAETDVWEGNTQMNPDVEPLVWALGKGYSHHLEGAHSGEKAWHTSRSQDLSQNQFQEYIGDHFVESPYFNLAGATEPTVMNFWFKDKYDTQIGYYDNEYAVEYNLDCAQYWYPVEVIQHNQDDEWDTFTIALDAFSAAETIKFRIRYHGNYLNPDGIVFDDMYIGPNKPDLTIERTQYLRYTRTNQAQMTLKYYLMNGGSADAPSVTTRFYWSTDAVFDASDADLGTHTANALPAHERSWNDFTFTKPQTAAGTYYIFYVTDQANTADEMREGNNTGYFTVSQIAPVAFPYANDFEGAASGWEHFADLGTDDWTLRTITEDDGFKPEFAQTKAFVAQNNNKQFSPMSRTFLFTPAFDLTTSVSPVLEFSMSANNLGNICNCANGATNLSYSTDAGATWQVLQPQNESFSHWYDELEYDEYTAKDVYSHTNFSELLENPSEPVFAFDYQYTGRDMDRNTYFAIDIAHLKDYSDVRFRFATATGNPDYENDYKNGIVIDNFTVREAYADLLVPHEKQLFVSDLAESFGMAMWIKNVGNARSAATTVRYYLSTDNAYDATDHFLSELPVGSIAPDAKFYISTHFTPAVDLGDYQYLVYKIDNANAVTEADENNNNGAWPLITQGVTQYPYADNFDADVIHGWNGWSEEDFASGTPAPYRMAHVHPPTAHTYYLYSADKMWYSELVPTGSWQESWTPTFYLQSPSFDFSAATEPLFLSFDFFINGAQFQNGGNLEYSTDGGNSWAVMTQEMGTSTNWYQSGEFYALDDMNEPGWSWSSTDYTFRHATFDLAFLDGETDVVFRFKHYSNFSVNSSMAPVGMRIDNFIVGSASDINLCLANVPYQYDFTTYPGMCWSESNDNELSEGLNGLAGDWGVTTGFANSGNDQTAVIMIGQAGNANGDWLVSPDFDIDGTDMPNPQGLQTGLPHVAKFRIALTQPGSTLPSSLGSDDVVQFVYSQNDGPWTVLRTWNSATPISAAGEQVNVGVELSGRVKFAFWATKGLSWDEESSDFFVDKFELTEGTLSVAEPEELEVRYYPNPAREVFYVSAFEDIDALEILTIAGRKVLGLQPNSNEAEVNLSSLSPGLYFVNVKSQQGKTRTIKLVKK